MRFWWCLIILLLPVGACAQQKGIDSSVMIQTDSSSGSGVCVRNGKKTFVWTAAHVVSRCMHAKTSIDPRTGTHRVYVYADDVWCKQASYQDGRETGEVKKSAKIIRFNFKEDLAVLQIYEHDWPAKTAQFVKRGYIPKIGTEFWHIGSSSGINGVFPGHCGVTGRVIDEVVYDEVTCAASWGCSGGGVFQKSDDKCIGLLDCFATQAGPGKFSYGHMCIVPARRMYDYAKRVRITYAIDPSVRAPKVDKEPICDEPIPMPHDYPTGKKH